MQFKHWFYFLDSVEDGKKDVGVVVGTLVLNNRDQSFEAHAAIDVFLGQRLQRGISFTIERHEDQVPNLQHVRIVHVH